MLYVFGVNLHESIFLIPALSFETFEEFSSNSEVSQKFKACFRSTIWGFEAVMI